MTPFASWPRFLAVLLCLFVTKLGLDLRGFRETVVSHTDVSSFPNTIDAWKGTDINLTADDLAVLGSGQFLLRDYDRAGTPTVTLFLAYYASQRSGDTMHSPKNCLPGSGWTPTKAAVVKLPSRDGREIVANQYVVSQGADKMLVLYWYQAHGRTVASEYWAKWFLVRDAIRMNRTDGGLVRVLTSVEAGETEEDAEKRVVEFAQTVSPLLEGFIPR